MRWFVIAVALLAFASALAPPAQATGGQQTFRILTHGDIVVAPIAVVVACNPGQATGAVQCGVVRDMLGYDGLTGAVWKPVGHVGHAFVCAATTSATPGLESISVGFDINGDTLVDASSHYPSSTYKPLDETGVMPGGVRVPGTGIPEVDDTVGLPATINPQLLDGFVLTGVLRGGFWPSVSGEVLGEFAFLFNHLGEDVTVDCAF